MKKVLLKTALLPLALLLGAGTAVAAGSQHSFDDLDTNGDGSLSAEETMSVEGLDLVSADTDGNGELSEDEFKAAQESMKGDDHGSDKQGTEEPSTY